MSNQMNSFAIEYILPKRYAKEPLPVLYNSWEATGFNVHSKGQQKLAKMAADIEEAQKKEANESEGE
jgi:alpha-galactosidase